jgi:Na+/proline symporter
MFQGLSPELSAMLLAAIIGGYTLIGGLGATFYVSYFNTGSIFILILLLIVEVNTKRWGGMFDFEIFW